MAGAVDRLADLCDAARYPGRGLVVHDAHRLYRVLPVCGELFLDHSRIGAVPPVARHKIDLEPEPGRHLTPQGCEMPGLEHQHPVARRQAVAQRCLPGPGAGRRVDDDIVLGLKDPPHAGHDLLPETPEFRPAMVDRRHRDRLQYAVRHIGRAGDLQKMAAGMRWRCVLHRRCRSATAGWSIAALPPQFSP